MKSRHIAFATLMALTSAAQADHSIIDMEVKGMVCAYCAAGIESALNKRDDVADVDVEMDRQLVTVATEPGTGPSDAELHKLVKRNGYNIAAVQRYDHTRDAPKDSAGSAPMNHDDAHHEHTHDHAH